jgi:hypothetical protein
MYYDVDYIHSEAEFEEMRHLLAESYAVSRKPLNWRLAMAENGNYASRYLEPLDTLCLYRFRGAGSDRQPPVRIPAAK